MVIDERRSIVIVGAGQLGSRYLQGLARCSHRLRIQVVDPAPEALTTAADRWTAVGGAGTWHEVSFHQGIGEVSRQVEIAIVATTALRRSDVVEAIGAHADVGSWILEKVLAQGEDELRRIVAAVGASMAWVNTWGRSTPWYQQIRGSEAVGPIRFHVGGASWGMACNAIHFLDLMCWWTGEDLVEVDAAGLDDEWLIAKRPGFMEISGDLVAKYSGGSTGVLRAGQPPDARIPAGRDALDILDVEWSSGRWQIERPASEEDGLAIAADGRCLPGRIERQSERSTALIDGLLEGSCCSLTDLPTSVAQHGILIRALLARWREVSGPDAECVPIT